LLCNFARVNYRQEFILATTIPKIKNMETMIKNQNIEAALKNSYNYIEYRQLIAALRAQNKATGDNHSDAYLNYTDLNIGRMDKWDKRFLLSDEQKAKLENLETKQTWLVITEGWCGDAAHVVPVLAKLAAASRGMIDLRLVLRDDNLPLMDDYLTNGGRSIPKLIRFNEEGEELGTWGPRPEDAQQIMTDGKAAGREKSDITIDLQKWYARDRGAQISAELIKTL
jgi:hypothetical protein